MAAGIAVVVEEVEPEDELGADGCPTAELVLELLGEARVAIAEHGPDSDEAAAAELRLQTAQQTRAHALAKHASMTNADFEAMRRRGVDDFNRRLEARRAESAVAARQALDHLYASLRAVATASMTGPPRPRTTSRARDRRRRRGDGRAQRTSSRDDPSPPPPPRERLCEWPGCDQPVASNRCDARYCTDHRGPAKQKTYRDRKRIAERRRVERVTIAELFDAAARAVNAASFGGRRSGVPTHEQLAHARRVDAILTRILGGVPVAKAPIIHVLRRAA